MAGDTQTPEREITRKPGDPRPDIDSMIRVDQAGEYGATRIYAGQLAILGDRSPAARSIARMAAQEDRHHEGFNALMTARGVRPTLLQPLWDRAGYALGAVTALIGPEAAMACTAAVETEIDKHYTEQLDALGTQDPELSEMVAQYREEEREHHDTAIAQGAESAPAYPLLSGAIRLACKVAIAASKRV